MTDLELMRKMCKEGHTEEVAKLLEQRDKENKGPFKYDGTLEEFVKEFNLISIEDYERSVYNKYRQTQNRK